MIKEIKSWADSRGYKIAWGGVSVVMDVREEFDSLLADGRIDRGFYEANLGWFDYPEGIALENPASAIIIAVPSSAYRLLFESEKGPLETILPPTYMKYQATYREVLDDLRSSVFRGACKAELLKVPLKATAVRLGLATYGRNNVTYVEGMGSYLQLVGILTDAKLPGFAAPDRAAPAIRPECLNCGICIDACPTGAIAEERFLIRAERCFTLSNESADPWPEWIKPSLERCFSAEPCVVGCLRCQAVCPMNADRLEIKEAGVSFTAEETDWILAGKPCDNHPVGALITEKLEIIGRSEDCSCFGKNLREIKKYR